MGDGRKGIYNGQLSYLLKHFQAVLQHHAWDLVFSIFLFWIFEENKLLNYHFHGFWLKIWKLNGKELNCKML